MIFKTNLDEMFLTDKESEEDGIWVEVDTTKSLKIRANSAKAVTDLREQLMKPYAMLQRSGGKLSDDKSEEIGLRVIAGGVIADWKGIESIEGEGEDAKAVPINYSADNAYKLLKAMPRFANFVVGISMDGQMYKDTVREDGVKN